MASWFEDGDTHAAWHSMLPDNHLPNDDFLTAQPLSCTASAYDIVFKGSVAKVVCPAHCQLNHGSVVHGSTAHPFRSAICESGILDGVLPTSGGKMLVTKTPGLPSYVGKDVGTAASLPVTDEKGPAFHLYALDTIDQIQNMVRLLDPSGTISSKGLLQSLTAKGFGSVCGANQAAAEVVCHQMHFRHGAVSMNKCNAQAGYDYCGAQGSPVSMKHLKCRGHEKTIWDCHWENPDAECADHKHDAVIACWNGRLRPIPEGELRMVTPNGEVTKDGSGRLQVWYNDEWGDVCGQGFTPNNALVACRSMGYEGASTEVMDKDPHLHEGEKPLPSDKPPAYSEVMCKGTEGSLQDCSHEEGSDKLCEKPALLQCYGSGTPQGLRRLDAPLVHPAPFAPRRRLQCDQPIADMGLDAAPPGTTMIASCPRKCLDNGQVKGSFIFPAESPVCLSAKHAGIIGAKGGDVVVTTGYGQPAYFGSKRNDINSQDAPAAKDPNSGMSFTVSAPTPELLSRVALGKFKAERYAGNSTFGDAIRQPSSPYEYFL